jgi:hypothetical protein
MTMHLEGPWLTTTGKIRSKRRKYASADAARKARDLQAQWEQRQQEWAKLSPRFSTARVKPSTVAVSLAPKYPPGREPQQHIPSLDTGVKGAVTVKATPQYTGTKIRGIGTMHKSNAVPIFSDDEAVAIAHMRR